MPQNIPSRQTQRGRSFEKLKQTTAWVQQTLLAACELIHLIGNHLVSSTMPHVQPKVCSRAWYFLKHVHAQSYAHIQICTYALCIWFIRLCACIWVCRCTCNYMLCICVCIHAVVYSCKKATTSTYKRTMKFMHIYIYILCPDLIHTCLNTLAYAKRMFLRFITTDCVQCVCSVHACSCSLWVSVLDAQLLKADGWNEMTNLDGWTVVRRDFLA